MVVDAFLSVDLVLPEEECLQEAVCFVCIRAPKPGCGWWQLLFQELDPSSMLYPSSASTYWRRRDKIADALGIPVGAQLTPGSLRPNGTIHLNHSGFDVAATASSNLDAGIVLAGDWCK